MFLTSPMTFWGPASVWSLLTVAGTGSDPPSLSIPLDSWSNSRQITPMWGSAPPLGLYSRPWRRPRPTSSGWQRTSSLSCSGLKGRASSGCTCSLPKPPAALGLPKALSRALPASHSCPAFPSPVSMMPSNAYSTRVWHSCSPMMPSMPRGSLALLVWRSISGVLKGGAYSIAHSMQPVLYSFVSPTL